MTVITLFFFLFFFNDTATTEIYTLSLHDALPISIVFLVLVLATVNGFLMLDLIYVLTMGGPGHDTTTVSWLGFQTTFTFFKFGPGTAILYTLTALCLLLTFVYQRLLLARFEPEA